MAGNIFALFFTMFEVLPLSGEPALRQQPVLGILRDEYGTASEAVRARFAAGVSSFEANGAFGAVHCHDSLDRVHDQFDIRTSVAV